jgi:hypothetical protein
MSEIGRMGKIFLLQYLYSSSNYRSYLTPPTSYPISPTSSISPASYPFNTPTPTLLL